jgi:putative aldouronate transport system substrate-binding protein
VAVLMIAMPMAFATGTPEKATQDADKLAGIGFQPTGFPIVTQTVTLKVMAQRDVFHKKEFSEFQLIKDLEQQTNVKIVWDLVPANAWIERVNLAFASGDLPDVFLRTIPKNMQLQYGEQGLLLPLAGLLEKYAPNLKTYYAKYPALVAAATSPEGRMYALPGRSIWGFSANPDTLLINDEWLRKLGLAMPTTINEFEAVLRAFKTRDPNGNGKQDEIPFSFRWGDNIQGVASLFGMFGLLDYPGKHVVVQNGKVVFTANKPQYR